MRDIIPSSDTGIVEPWHNILFWMFPTLQHKVPESGQGNGESKKLARGNLFRGRFDHQRSMVENMSSRRQWSIQ